MIMALPAYCELSAKIVSRSISSSLITNLLNETKKLTFEAVSLISPMVAWHCSVGDSSDTGAVIM